ncbi:FadR/GntR family transcriptional regulator [Aggregatilinea lenta]|uniref:FadR/GntR family transcriptional regulator n=1 Tax=Aggregatilinea lenta TaxID=913108 RepID=UPI000E5BFC80|nr:FadR/GntR family transcriptional regulator [Aggregatilinea lenta]
MIHKLRGPALSQSVRDYIKDFIITQKLQAGDPLPSENQLAEDLGVGRSSVREAVKALQSLGIIEARHGNGLFVREWNLDPVLETLEYGLKFNTKSLAELLDIRMWLESAVMYDVVEIIDAATIARLDDLIARWEAQIRAGDYDDALIDADFHRMLYGALDNETMLKLFEVFWIAFRTFKQDPPTPERKLENVFRHRAVIDAVKRGDAEAAKQELVGTYMGLRTSIRARATTEPQPQ